MSAALLEQYTDSIDFNPEFRPITPTQDLQNAAIEMQDDAYYDVQSDDSQSAVDIEMPPSQALALSQQQSGMDMIVQLAQQHVGETMPRKYDSFIIPGVLETYQPELSANALNNPLTAKIFAHFIFTIGPMLSIFERQPRNQDGILGKEAPLALFEQGIWTYTLPSMALKHGGLLQAMCALSSLHIARLDGASETPARKHYAFAKKRVKICARDPTKKGLATTLATALLIGFYEVMTAAHAQWCTALSGAAHLLSNMDLKAKTRDFILTLDQKAQYDQSSIYDGYTPLDMTNEYMPSSSLLDYSLVETLAGTPLDRTVYPLHTSHPAYLSSENRKTYLEGKRAYSENTYELIQDLFWWFARQDVYQSLIAGNRLLFVSSSLTVFWIC